MHLVYSYFTTKTVTGCLVWQLSSFVIAFDPWLVSLNPTKVLHEKFLEHITSNVILPPPLKWRRWQVLVENKVYSDTESRKSIKDICQSLYRWYNVENRRKPEKCTSIHFNPSKNCDHSAPFYHIASKDFFCF